VRNDNVITYPKNQSLEASDTFQAGQKQRAGYVPTYASATISSAEHLTILERIPQNVDAALSRLTTTNYQVDRSVREAILATPELVKKNMEHSSLLALTGLASTWEHLVTHWKRQRRLTVCEN
jgi:hypothetical protein